MNRYNNFNKYNQQRQQKKVFTIDQIKEDIDFSIFVTRLFYVGYSLDYVCMNTHKMKQSDINTYVARLKELGLITITNITKANENLIECLNKQHPNYYKNVDFKTDVIYLQTKTLFGNKQLMLDIKDKWIDNEYYTTAYLQIENEYTTTQYLIGKLKKINSVEGKRTKSFPDGTTIQIETSKQKQLNLISAREVKFKIDKNSAKYIEQPKSSVLSIKQHSAILQLQNKDRAMSIMERAKNTNLEQQAKDEFKNMNKFNKEQDKLLEKESSKHIYGYSKKQIKDINNTLEVDSFSDILEHIAPDTKNVTSNLIKEKVKKIEITREDRDKLYLLNKIKMGCKKSKQCYEKNYGAIEE